MIKIDGGWEELFGLLRREIEGYGQLFAVLESQRSCLKVQDLEGILDCNSGLESQARSLGELRQERLDFCRLARRTPREPERFGVGVGVKLS